MNGAPFNHLKLKNNLHERVKTLINNPLFFNQRHVVNILVKPLMCLMRLGDTDKPRMDQVLYYVYRTDEHFEKHAPKLNDPAIFPPDAINVPDLTEADDPDEEDLAQGAEDEYYSSDDEADEENSGDEEEEEDDVVPETQDHGLDSTSNGGLVMKIWGRRRINFINDMTMTAYCLSPLKFVYDHAASNNAQFEHTLACDRMVIRLFGQGKSEAEKNALLDTFNTEKRLFRGKLGPYSRTHIWSSHLLDNQEPHLWHQQYSLGATKVLGRVACRVTSKVVGIGSAEKNWKDVKLIHGGKYCVSLNSSFMLNTV